jgi:DNA sulfur modification protein DndB
MGFLNEQDIHELKSSMTSDISLLGKLFRAKDNTYQQRTIDHSMVDDFISEGWEEDANSRLKTKTKIRREKPHNVKFEDDIWCQLYKLGYRNLNIDENFRLPFSPNSQDKKQIDVIAVNDESILVVECKSSEERKSAPSFREEIDAMSHRMDGYRKALKQLFGDDKKIQFIFATRNLPLKKDGEDIKRLAQLRVFYYDDNTYEYVNNLISKYKNAAPYQFQGLIFKGKRITSEPISVPALRGTMGGKGYYVFALEPETLLKIGFVLHRTRANDTEFPTYQRLLVPTRLSGITKFIDDGGFFPNSIILNFNTNGNKLIFEDAPRVGDTHSKAGILKIPNAYGIAYIIDGQHRVYGYANSKHKKTNTIPVVAFFDLESEEQLKIFMDINQNQKAVSPSLRLDLEEDLYWESEKADSRIKALKSSIIKVLANEPSSTLYRQISVGEDTADLTFAPFYKALTSSGLVPAARGNKYSDDSIKYSIYNTSNLDHSVEMRRAKKRVSDFIIKAYDYAATNYSELVRDEKSFILSNRGTFAYISLLGSLNKHAIAAGVITNEVDTESRFNAIEKYLAVLFENLSELDEDSKETFWGKLGAGADTEWLRRFQMIVHERMPDYNPEELTDWKQRQDESLQEEARKISVDIERRLKKGVLEKLKLLYEENWELEINSIKRDCMRKAQEEMERHYKEGLTVNEIHWTDMLTISDYKNIIDKSWSKKPSNNESEDFSTFAEDYAINIGEAFNSKSEKLKWMSYFGKYRNTLAHEGTKGKGLNREEVDFLHTISAKLPN